MIHNERITLEALLINCSSCVHISFTVHLGLALASSFTLRSSAITKFRSACTYCSNGKVECFGDCTIKQLHINCIQKKYSPFCFHPFSPCVSRRSWDWANSRRVETICKTAKKNLYTVFACIFQTGLICHCKPLHMVNNVMWPLL